MAAAESLTLTGTPNPKQAEFFKSRARHTCYGGARGGGKSWAMRRKAVLLALNYPDLNILILRRTLPELRVNIVEPLMKELYGFAEYNVTERVFRFPNGSKIRMGFCDSEADVYQYQGHEYDVICLEEATHFTETQMQFLTTCNRSVRTDFTPRMYYTCNPGGVGHGWVKERFITAAQPMQTIWEQFKVRFPDGHEETRWKSRIFVPSSVFDNKILLANNPDYLTSLASMPEQERKALLYGSSSATGQVSARFYITYTNGVMTKTYLSEVCTYDYDET